MAIDEHLARLKNKRNTWNVWRYENIGIRPDLSGSDLREERLDELDLRAADFTSAVLTNATLSGANLIEANLFWANLAGANLNNADLSKADLRSANLNGADLSGADLSEANLKRTNLRNATLSRANLSRANLNRANLSGANLSGGKLVGANFRDAVLKGTNLSAADLEASTLVNTDLAGADLTGCRIHGASAWCLKMDAKTKQRNLVITRRDEPAITVDNIEVAQFIYLMLSNQKIRDVIDTITSKAVLILGRFTDDRKAVLDALRDCLRERGYLPILSDFKGPERRNVTETVTLLARMARFIIADLTDPCSIPQELQAIIPSVRVPIQPLLLEGSSLYSMFEDFDPQDFHWVLPIYQYKETEQLLAVLAEKVIAPAEEKVEAMAKRRRTIEAELAQPQ